MKLKSLHSISLALCMLLLVACTKRKTEQMLVGEWKVIDRYTDGAQMLETEFRTDTIHLVNCAEPIFFVVYKSVEIDLLLTKQKNFKRTILTHYLLPDTSDGANCNFGFKDSLITEEQTGKWQLSGKSSLQLVFGKSSEVNKITEIDGNTMKWETDVVVNQGIVSFNGIINTSLKKVN